MQQAAHLVAHDFQEQYAADALEAAGGAARAAADEHTQREHHPRDVRPLAGIIVEDPRSGDERHHLEEAVAHGIGHVVAT